MSRESEIRARQDVNAFRGLDEWRAHAPDDLAFLLAEVVRLRTALREAIQVMEDSDHSCEWARAALGEDE